MVDSILVSEDYEDVRQQVTGYDEAKQDGRPHERYVEFTLSGNSVEEQPVTIDLEKYVTHRPVVEEESHLDPALHPSEVSDR
jgi:hypothetical protein